MGNKQSKKKWTREDIDKSDRLLFLLGRKVIDATDVLDNHPGGSEILLQNRGKDITLALWIHRQTNSKTHITTYCRVFKGEVIMGISILMGLVGSPHHNGG